MSIEYIQDRIERFEALLLPDLLNPLPSCGFANNLAQLLNEEESDSIINLILTELIDDKRPIGEKEDNQLIRLTIGLIDNVNEIFPNSVDQYSDVYVERLLTSTSVAIKTILSRISIFRFGLELNADIVAQVKDCAARVLSFVSHQFQDEVYKVAFVEFASKTIGIAGEVEKRFLSDEQDSSHSDNLICNNLSSIFGNFLDYLCKNFDPPSCKDQAAVIFESIKIAELTGWPIFNHCLIAIGETLSERMNPEWNETRYFDFSEDEFQGGSFDETDLSKNEGDETDKSNGEIDPDDPFRGCYEALVKFIGVTQEDSPATVDFWRSILEKDCEWPGWYDAYRYLAMLDLDSLEEYIEPALLNFKKSVKAGEFLGIESILFSNCEQYLESLARHIIEIEGPNHSDILKMMRNAISESSIDKPLYHSRCIFLTTIVKKFAAKSNS